MRVTTALLLLLSASAAFAGQLPVPGEARLDEMQFVATHNSYHQAPDSAILDYLRNSGFNDGPIWTGPRLARAIDYSREPLSAQLDAGIRALELDVRDDPEGDRFVRLPLADELARRGSALDRPWDPQGDMRRPGFKTIHKLAYDPRSSCPLFEHCLQEIADWSDRHPDHELITIMVEVKPVAGVPCDALCDDGWRRLETALITRLGSKRILAPLRTGQSWPTMRAVRGKVMILLLDSESTAASYRRFVARGGADRIFTALRPGKNRPLRPDGRSRIAILPEPGDPRIAIARRMGMLVYTRADAETEEARANDTRRRDIAFASGATFIATDYPMPDRRFSDYAVRFPGEAYVRCNPRSQSRACKDDQAAR